MFQQAFNRYVSFVKRCCQRHARINTRALLVIWGKGYVGDLIQTSYLGGGGL
jgi:hypothetical protein